jgi:hypothetical protein
LTRRAALVPRGFIENIGKESNELRQTPGLTQDEDEVVQVYRDRSDVPFDRYRVLLRAIPKRDLISLTGLGERTIAMTRRGRSTPTRENQKRLLRAIITYLSCHPAPRFETVEQLNPLGIAGEIRARALVVDRQLPVTEAALEKARVAVATWYEEALIAAIGTLSP